MLDTEEDDLGFAPSGDPFPFSSSLHPLSSSKLFSYLHNHADPTSVFAGLYPPDPRDRRWVAICTEVDRWTASNDGDLCTSEVVPGQGD